jgi:cysteine-rich repeat protein
MRRPVLLGALLIAAGCYSPTYLVGLECSVKDTCPPGQGCNPEHKCMPTATFDGGAGGAGGKSASGAAGRSGAGGISGAAGAGDRVDAGTDGGSTVDAGPRCGDGHLDPGEECDDHNTTAGDGCSSTCQLEGLIGHWALDTEYLNGATVPDLVTPNGHPGTVVAVGDNSPSGLATNRYGVPSSALSINGNDLDSPKYAYVKIPTLTSLTAPVTMTIWINQQAGNGEGLVFGIDQGPQLYQESYAISLRVPSSANNYSSAADVPLTNNQWVFVAGVFSQTGGAWKLTLYVNGAPQSATPAVASVPTNGNVDIGGLYGSCSNAEQVCDSGFVGDLNDARIYNRTLTPQEVQNLYAFVPAP